MSDQPNPPAESGRPAYQFRWSNIDLEDFVAQRRFAAEVLRRDAAILTRRAEQIEEEARTWEAAFELADAR